MVIEDLWFNSEAVIERGFLKIGKIKQKKVHHWKITVLRC